MTDFITLADGESFIGRTARTADLLDITLVCDTSIYANNDVLAIPQEVPGCYRVPGGRMELKSLVLIDEDDQGVAVDIVFFSATASLGTINGASSLSDADSRKMLGHVSVAAADYIDYGGTRTADLKGIGLILEDTAGTQSLWVGAMVRSGTPTYSASGLRLRLGLEKY